MEYEVRFLEIDELKLARRLIACGAIDLGMSFITESIFYDEDGAWSEQGELVRLRSGTNTPSTLTYKHHIGSGVAEELETEVADIDTCAKILLRAGLRLARKQEKRRRSIRLNSAIFDFDSWPGIPTYVEVEASTMETVASAVMRAGLDMKDADTSDARAVLLQYGVDLNKTSLFVFDSSERSVA